MPPSSTLFSVRVSTGQTHWRVLVRAATDTEARDKVGSRGHNVVSVEPATLDQLQLGLAARHPPTICLNCQYSLRGLEHGEALEVLCPECGVTNLPLALPQKIDTIAALDRVRKIRRVAWGFVGMMILALFILWLWL